MFDRIRRWHGYVFMMEILGRLMSSKIVFNMWLQNITQYKKIYIILYVVRKGQYISMTWSS